MQDVILKLGHNGRGDFFIMDGVEQLAKMEIGVSGNTMIVYHTYVAPEAEGKGFAKKLLAAMVDYVRKNNLKVIPLCHFVRGQFNQHPEEYADVWYKEGPGNQIKDKSDPWVYT